MGTALHKLGIDRMSVEERIALAQEIWDSIAVEAGLLPPTDEEKAELDRRLAEDDAMPDDIVSWDTLKENVSHRWKR